MMLLWKKHNAIKSTLLFIIALNLYSNTNGATIIITDRNIGNPVASRQERELGLQMVADGNGGAIFSYRTFGLNKKMLHINIEFIILMKGVITI